MDGRAGLGGPPDNESVIMDTELLDGALEQTRPALEIANIPRSPLGRTRSLSDGGGTPARLLPSPHIIQALRGPSKDDSDLQVVQPSVTPRRQVPKLLSLQLPPPRHTTPPPPSSCAPNHPLNPLSPSPKVELADVYASPTNILPRRSRGLEFSRAATSLHHSTLADHSSPDSSPTTGDRVMSFSGGRRDHNRLEQTTSSLWSMMGHHERMNMGCSLGSSNTAGSDSSSPSDDDNLMEDDTDDAYMATPSSKAYGISGQMAIGDVPSMSAVSGLTSFQQRQRPRKRVGKKMRGPLGFGFHGGTSSLLSPTGTCVSARRESISWQANQLRISGNEASDNKASNKDTTEGGGVDGQRDVIRRPVTRWGNLLPKTKTFARIRAALAEEGAPAEAETRREAEVVKQVRESDIDLEPRNSPQGLDSLAAASAVSSPRFINSDLGDEPIGDDAMADLAPGSSELFKRQAMRHHKGKPFWDTFSNSSSLTGGITASPPPPPPLMTFLPRRASSGVSEDTSMDSPLPSAALGITSSRHGSTSGPSAAEITRRINGKRRCDDLDSVSFKRRAVSPGMSVHNSPILQSPLQRDSGTWSSRSDGEKGGAGSSAPSEAGSMAGTPSNAAVGTFGRLGGKGRVGFQGMVDTHDGLMRMSIE